MSVVMRTGPGILNLSNPVGNEVRAWGHRQ
jgi:hypothetical protein